MEKQGISLDDLYDVNAFRVILEGGTEQVYSALGIFHAIWRPVPGRFKDYVALPKPNAAMTPRILRAPMAFESAAPRPN